MGYKLLGYVVWRGAKWYVRRRVSEKRRRLAFAGISVVVIAGAVAAQRGARPSAPQSSSAPMRGAARWVRAAGCCRLATR